MCDYDYNSLDECEAKMMGKKYYVCGIQFQYGEYIRFVGSAGKICFDWFLVEDPHDNLIASKSIDCCNQSH